MPQTAQGIEHRGTPAAMSGSKVVVRTRGSLVPNQERLQAGEMVGARSRRLKWREPSRQLQQGTGGAIGAAPARSVAAAPHRDEALERRQLAEIAGIAQRTVKGGYVMRRQPRLVWTKPEVRRPQERNGRTARKIAGREGNDEVQRRCERLRRQWKRIKHLYRDTARSEDLSRQVHVRERTTDDQRHSTEGRYGALAAPHFAPDPPRKAGDLLFAIARGVRGGAAGRDQQDR